MTRRERDLDAAVFCGLLAAFGLYLLWQLMR